jgi:cell division protein FtsB
MLIDFPKTQNLSKVLTFFFKTNETLSPSKLPLLIVQASLIFHHHIIHQTNQWQSFAICYEEQKKQRR